MLLTAPEAGMAGALTSQALMLRAWHDAANDVEMLLHLLRLAVPSLAEALAAGLLTAGAAGARNLVVVRHRRASVFGVGRRDDGSDVLMAHVHAREVTQFEVRGISIDNQAAHRIAA